MSADSSQRVVFAMLDEETLDNLCLVRENIETNYPGLAKPQNISDIVTILINYWYDGKR
jgi:hypothetical protein